jgi:glycerophosphoryl diester phosphodiesterase
VPPSYEGIAIVTAESVAAAHRHGLEVHVWTIDDPAEMNILLDLGVDGIMTNLPALGLDVFRRRGLR